MSITSYKQNNKTFYEVFASRRSKVLKHIRVQKRERGFESKGQAQRREKELIAKCVLEVSKKEGVLPSWGEVVLQWEKFKRTDCAIQEDSVDDYVHSLQTWTQSIWEKTCNEINKGDIRMIITNVESEGRSNGFQRKVLNRIKAVYTWGREEGIIRGGLDNITSGIKVSRTEEKVPEILSFEQIRTLLEEAKKRNNPWYPIWAMALWTGMRNGELVALEWSDIDFDNDKVTVSKSFNKRKNLTKSTKSGYFRNIPMNKSLRDLLLELKRESRDKFVLPRVEKWMNGSQASTLRKFCIEIGVPSVKFHSLRACFATHLLSKGVPLGKVKKICGWTELETMDRYVRLAGVDERGATACLDSLAPDLKQENVLNLMNIPS